jgi:hypothetical protein
VAVGLSSDDVEVRRLAELKTFLEERLADLDREMESLKALLELVDRELAARSFKKAPPPEAAEKEEAAALRMIRSRSGTLLATMSLKEKGELVVQELPGGGADYGEIVNLRQMDAGHNQFI